mmetsp:Transcript_130841/g.378544  ORF Transcript_130841/g.378544 Transcript_130841/m.378544 type:complete len:295 (-) Transcript_130841:181-1065(-)
MVLPLVLLGVLIFLAGIEVLQLPERSAHLHQLVQRWRILALAIPATWRVALPILRVHRPRLRLLGDVHDLENADQPVLRGVRLLEEPGVRLHALLVLVAMELPQQGLTHHLRRSAVGVHRKLAARRVSWADVGVHRVPDAGHVRGLGEVVAASARPQQHVVRKVPDDVMSLLLGAGQGPAQGGDVLVVPGVAVRDGRAVRDAVDLIAVVPPRHHPRVLGRVVPQPPVGLSVVVNDNCVSSDPAPEHDLRLGHPIRHRPAIRYELRCAVAEQEQNEDRAPAPQRRSPVVCVPEGL